MKRWKTAVTVALLALPGVMNAQAASDYDKVPVTFTCIAATDCDPNISGQLLLQAKAGCLRDNKSAARGCRGNCVLL